MRDRIVAPPCISLVDNVSVHTLGQECLGRELQAIDIDIAAAIWAANRLVFVPLILTESLLVNQFFWENGSVVNGNTDVGVYSFDGQTKLGSTGSTANSSTDSIQLVNVTDFRLPSNTRLWMTLGCDSATQQFFRANPSVMALDYVGVTEQLSGWSSGLPATITPATPTVAVVPLFGFTGASVI